MKISYIRVDSIDPAFNLALEQYAFEQLPKDRGYFFLWQNTASIIVGRHQNSHAEINSEYVRCHGIKVHRRLSGGGAVYHDLGNLNFTFIVDAPGTVKIDLHQFCLPVAQALCQLGAEAEVNGRNDILISGRKVSGNAQYLRHGRVMHHGTLLFDSDLTVLSQALNVRREKIESKGVKSVESRVCTIKNFLHDEISMEEFKQLLISKLFAGTEIEEYRLSSEDIAAINTIKRQRYDSYDWNYGRSPECTVIREKYFDGCGSIEAHISLDRGRINDVSFWGDFFSSCDPAILAAKLTGLRPEPEEYLQLLQDVDVSEYFSGLESQQFIELMSL